MPNFAYVPPGVSTNPDVTRVLAEVEARLRPALVEAIEACNAGLAGRTEGTKPLHSLLAHLHSQVATIDEHATNRAQRDVYPPTTAVA